MSVLTNVAMVNGEDAKTTHLFPGNQTNVFTLRLMEHRTMSLCGRKYKPENLILRYADCLPMCQTCIRIENKQDGIIK